MTAGDTVCPFSESNPGPRRDGPSESGVWFSNGCGVLGVF